MSRCNRKDIMVLKREAMFPDFKWLRQFSGPQRLTDVTLPKFWFWSCTPPFLHKRKAFQTRLQTHGKLAWTFQTLWAHRMKCPLLFNSSLGIQQNNTLKYFLFRQISTHKGNIIVHIVGSVLRMIFAQSCLAWKRQIN